MAGGIVYIKQYIEGVSRSVAYWSDDSTLTGNLSPVETQLAVSSASPTPVSGTLASATQSTPFTPATGRDFNVFVAATANTTQLERQRDGSTWEVVLTPALIAALPPSFAMSEPQANVPYRLNCTAYSASQAYGFSQ